MTVELKYENKLYRFRVGLVSVVSRYGTKDDNKMDYELTCISEEFPEKLKCKVFNHFEYKNYVLNGLIKEI